MKYGAAIVTSLRRTVDAHILKLRKKLENDPAEPEYILTVYGEGYKFVGLRLAHHKPVSMYSGSAGSFSNFFLSLRMCASTVRGAT